MISFWCLHIVTMFVLVLQTINLVFVIELYEGLPGAYCDCWMTYVLGFHNSLCLQARMDPKNGTTETSSFGVVKELTPEEFQKQEAGYVYRYRYNGGAATQVWLSHGRCGNLSSSGYSIL